MPLLIGMVRRIIAVSDVHLGTIGSNRDAFLSFLRTVCDDPEIDCLVFLGDIFDFWRGNNASIVMDNSDIIDMMSRIRAKEVHYVVGNHDYHMLAEADNPNLPFKVSKRLRLESGGNEFCFMHGYELEVLMNMESITVERYERFADRMCFSSNMYSYIVDHLWNIVEESGCIIEQIKVRFSPHKRKDIDLVYKFATSPGAYLLLGMNPNERLIFGHTHRPFVSYDNTVANTGCWTNDKELLKKWQNTYVEIINGDIYLRKYL